MPQDTHQHPGRRLALRVGIAFLLLYLLAIMFFVLLKRLLLPEIMPWPEVFYGPAITLSCCYALYCVAFWFDARGGFNSEAQRRVRR